MKTSNRAKNVEGKQNTIKLNTFSFKTIRIRPNFILFYSARTGFKANYNIFKCSM